MNREQFNNIIKDMPKNSVKRACYIVREYLRYSQIKMIEQDKVLKCDEGCAVTLEEYLEASRILLAYSYKNSDNKTEIELFQCINDCNNNNGCSGFCKGEFELSSEVKTLNFCRNYSDPYNI